MIILLLTQKRKIDCEGSYGLCCGCCIEANGVEGIVVEEMGRAGVEAAASPEHFLVSMAEVVFALAVFFH